MDNFLYAGLSSCIVNLIQPLQTLKTFKQAGIKPNYKIPILYRGYWGMTIIDIGAFSVHNIVNYETSDNVSVLNKSILAGIISTPLVTIGEYFVINKQINTLYKFKNMFSVKSTLLTLGREIQFPIFLFYISPLIGKHKNIKDIYKSELISGYLSGFICGICTNPFDRYKTLSQSDRHSNINIKNLFVGSIHRANYIGLTLSMLNYINSLRLIQSK